MPLNKPRLPTSVKTHETERGTTVYMVTPVRGEEVVELTLPELKEKYPTVYADYKALKEKEKKDAKNRSK